jgi:uncharacterized protein (DUF1501 family)
MTAPATYIANNDPELRYNNPITGGSAFNSLAQQMQIFACLIDASSNSGIGVRRQVFFISMGGFDTHDLQNRNHADLMARRSHGQQYFDSTLEAMASRGRVTLFTASDFGRTFTSNGDGTDHGWGANHFVLGGAVKGGDFHRSYPVHGEELQQQQFRRQRRRPGRPHAAARHVVRPARSDAGRVVQRPRHDAGRRVPEPAELRRRS